MLVIELTSDVHPITGETFWTCVLVHVPVPVCMWVCVGRCDKFVGIIIIAFSVVSFSCVHIFRSQKFLLLPKEGEKVTRPKDTNIQHRNRCKDINHCIFSIKCVWIIFGSGIRSSSSSISTRNSWYVCRFVFRVFCILCDSNWSNKMWAHFSQIVFSIQCAHHRFIFDHFSQ